MANAAQEVFNEIEQPFIKDDERHEESESVCKSLRNGTFWRICLYGLIMAFSFQFPDIVISQVGANYFNEDDDSDSCSSGNATYAYYSGIFESIGGVIAFLLEGYLGRLSDVYGRKEIMYFTWFCMFGTFAVMSVTDNIWFSLALSPLAMLTGSTGGSPSVLQAAIADSIPNKNHRTVIFALTFGLGGLIVLVAAVLCTYIVEWYGLKVPFYIFTGLMLIDLLWLIFVVEETLPPHKRVKEKAKYENPCKIFVEMKDNKVVIWFSVIVLVTAIPETGLNDMLTNYCNEQLNLCDASDATNKDALFTGTLGAVMLVSQLGFMPIMTKYMNDTALLMVGLIALESLMLFSGLLYFIPKITVALGIWVSYGAAYLLSPIVNGALSKRLSDTDQGVGIGIIHGVKGVTSAFAPYMFAGLYDLFDKDQWLVITPFIVGAVFILFGVLVVLGPLRKTMMEYDKREMNIKKLSIDHDPHNHDNVVLKLLDQDDTFINS